MTHDINVLRMWIRIAVIVAAVCTTAVPVLYSFFPWRKHRVGRLFMMQAIAFTATLDTTALFSIWTPKNVLLLFWIDAVILTAVALAEYSMALLLWSMKHQPREEAPLETEQPTL